MLRHAAACCGMLEPQVLVRNLFTLCVLNDRTPRGGKSQKTGFLGPLRLWHLEKSRARAENGKTQFPGARGPKIEKNVTTLSGLVVRYFFTFCILTHRTPRGGKSQTTGVLGPFGLGQRLGIWRNSGPKTEKCNFPELGALLGGKSIRPKRFLPKSAQLLDCLCFGRPDPQGQEITKYVFFRHFWPRAALGTWRYSGANTEKHRQPY